MSRLKILIVTAVVALMMVPGGAVLAQDAGVGGTAVVSDDLLLSDSITYALTGMPALADGKEYVGWLVSDNGSVQLSTGSMSLGSDGTIAHTFDHNSNRYTGENLVRAYSKISVTPEDVAADPDAPTGSPVAEASIFDKDAVRLLVTDSANVAGSGVLTILKNQIGIAILHANRSRQSITLDDVKSHAHHVINVIEGESGANFDAASTNPGDGVGIVGHTAEARGIVTGGGGSAGVVTDNFALVDIYAQSSENNALAARDQILNKVINETDKTTATIRMAAAVGYLESALHGVTGGDGGADQAYVSAQLMATYEFGAATEPELPKTGDPTIPLLAQMALIAAIALIATGGALTLNALRSRTTV